MPFASESKTSIQFFEIFHFETVAHSDRNEKLSRSSVHGVYVGEIDHCGFVSQMSEWGVDEVEMDAFHQHVSGDECLFVFCVADDGAVIAYSQKRRGLSSFDACCELSDEAKFT